MQKAMSSKSCYSTKGKLKKEIEVSSLNTSTRRFESDFFWNFAKSSWKQQDHLVVNKI